MRLTLLAQVMDGSGVHYDCGAQLDANLNPSSTRAPLEDRSTLYFAYILTFLPAAFGLVRPGCCPLPPPHLYFCRSVFRYARALLSFVISGVSYEPLLLLVWSQGLNADAHAGCYGPVFSQRTLDQVKDALCCGVLWGVLGCFGVV